MQYPARETKLGLIDGSERRDVVFILDFVHSMNEAPMLNGGPYHH